MITKICEECGKEFQARTKKQRFCSGPHFRECEVCGNMFLVKNLADDPHTCSPKCRTRLGTIRLSQKVGHEITNVSQLDEVREKKKISNASEESQEKMRNTCLERYGVERALDDPNVRKKLSESLKSKETREKIKQTFQKNHGVDHIFSDPKYREEHGCNTVGGRPDVQEKIKSTLMERYGTDKLYEIEGAIDKAKKSRSETVIDRYHVDNIFKSQEFKDEMIAKYGVDNPGKSHEIRTKIGQVKNNTFASDGTNVDSSYERIVYDFCLRNNLEFEYQKVSIPYDYSDREHITIIDFKIDGVLIECKGGHLMSGIFDYKENQVPMDVKLDVYSKNDVIVVTDEDGRYKFGKPNSTSSNGLKYKNKCPNPLIGIDIELFTENPKFPYDEKKPKCFYDVKVDGQMSSKEAFYDEGIRWKMIKNRILYSGGFIDGKQILNALNVTRTCKQPSSFSKKLARDIITKYCTSDVIVDPFAGWGARCDAANELKRIYIGCDFNKDLVDWHHEVGRTNISYYDACEFKYDGECSVFICPPYSDPKTGRCFEDYNFEEFNDSAKQKTQCDWMKICIENIPNAKEYILVCKIVDDGWENFIVETKSNKSHFGTNNEYILRLSNEDAKRMKLKDKTNEAS